jgi:hypothetical protein
MLTAWLGNRWAEATLALLHIYSSACITVACKASCVFGDRKWMPPTSHVCSAKAAVRVSARSKIYLGAKAVVCIAVCSSVTQPRLNTFASSLCAHRQLRSLPPHPPCRARPNLPRRACSPSDNPATPRSLTQTLTKAPTTPPVPRTPPHGYHDVRPDPPERRRGHQQWRRRVQPRRQPRAEAQRRPHARDLL